MRSSSLLLLVCAAGLGLAGTAAALPPGCVGEPSLAGRADIVFCEPWEDPAWWKNGYVGTPKLLTPIAASAADVEKTFIERDGCVSGACLRVNMLKGRSHALSLHWPLKNARLAPEQLSMRYYIKLGPTWDPFLCDKSGAMVGYGGKFPGLADIRASGDPAAPSGQCGNGGANGDGINCWSHRTTFRSCGRHGKREEGVCSTKPGAVTRFGGYLYHYQQHSSTGTDAPWDSDYWGQFRTGGGTCETNPRNLFCTVPRALRGVEVTRRRPGLAVTVPIGLDVNAGVFARGIWYAVELFVKMNEPGVADGVVRGWIDGVLAYEKTNLVFRIPGHHNLHVRTAWLDVYKGGTQGNCQDSNIWLDQMVLSTDGPIGPIANPGGRTPGR